MTALDPREEKKRKRERLAIIALSVMFALLTLLEFRITKVSSSLPFVNSIFFFGLLNINVVILIAIVWLVFRNIGKLFLERRSRILGARLKTKLVIAFLAFSIIPTLVLFIISSAYINSSFDKWFSLKVQNTLEASLEITRTYYRNAELTGTHFAEHLAKQMSFKLARAGAPTHLLETLPSWATSYLEEQRQLLALHSIEYYGDPLDERIVVQSADLQLPAQYPRLSLDHLQKVSMGENASVVQHVGNGDLIRCMVSVPTPSGRNGILVVNTYAPVSLVSKVDEIALVFDDYRETNPLQYPIKTAYFVILILITLVIIFVAIWIGLFLARELTVPVERLVYAAKAVGAGNLDVSIEASGKDEIATLVESFNRMIRDLRENRSQLDRASADLEKRRLELEAILANVGTGVLVVDPHGQITSLNRAGSKLIDVSPEAVLGRHFSKVFTEESSSLTEALSQTLANIETSSRSSSSPEFVQWTLRSGEEVRSLAAILTPLKEAGENWGVVVVIDDMTYLIKSQREVAWREVARRIAHEIKNPLTPIKLSAQRLQRRLIHVTGSDGALLKQCTETIIKHTDELKEMVNEFSNFARLPEINPAPHQINEVIHEVVVLYSQAHPHIQFREDFEPRLPIFEFDRDQLKRVFINLVENAVAAILSRPTSSERGSVRLATHYNEQLEIAMIDVEDNGPGMSEEVKARLFEPYFSTKVEGTGLGLAIAKRIVNDHDGFIRVHSTLGKGTQFVLELPTAPKRRSADRGPRV